MLLDPETLELAPVAADVLARTGDPRLKLELPASQLEVVVPPARERARGDRRARGRPPRRWPRRREGIARPAAAGVHPFSAPLGPLNAGERYDAILAAYGDVARAQLVCALQVHVAVGGADRTLAVYNALRGHLPELIALAANAPFQAGRDTGFATVRPLIAGLLPRQGVPPAIASWDAFAADLRWGRASGAVPEPRRWWFELRPHLAYGTLELRAADTQATVAESAAVAAFAHALVAWLAERHDAGEPLRLPGRLADRPQPLRRLPPRAGRRAGRPGDGRGRRRRARCCAAGSRELAPVAERLGCAAELAAAAALAERNGADRRRADGPDPRAVARALADAYLAANRP